MLPWPAKGLRPLPGTGALMLRDRSTWSVRALTKLIEIVLRFGNCRSRLSAVCRVYGVDKSGAKRRIVCGTAKASSWANVGVVGNPPRIATAPGDVLETKNCC